MQSGIRRAAAAAITASSLAGAAQAHHSLGVFDVSTPIWIKGTIVAYEPVAPHALIYLEETTADGQTRQWRIDGPWPRRLEWILEQTGVPQAGEFFKAGDVIEVCAFDLKAEIKAQRPPPDADDPPLLGAHGQMVVMPDGRLQSWGPYGQMDNCVRPDDAPALWIEFLNRDPLARQIWCTGRRLQLAPSITQQEFLDEVGRQMEAPCD